MKLLWSLCFLLLFGHIANAQQSDDKRMKIEMTLKQGSESIVAILSSSSITFNRPYEQEAEKPRGQPARNFNMAAYFDKPNIQALRAFIKNKNGIDGHIIMTDTYGRLPSRKFEFKSAVLDALSDQLTNDYPNMYLSIRASELTIDGLKIEL